MSARIVAVGGRRPVGDGLDAPPRRKVVVVTGHGRPTVLDQDQPVLAVVAVCQRAVMSEVAVQIVAEDLAVNLGVLIELVTDILYQCLIGGDQGTVAEDVP